MWEWGWFSCFATGALLDVWGLRIARVADLACRIKVLKKPYFIYLHERAGLVFCQSHYRKQRSPKPYCSPRVGIVMLHLGIPPVRNKARPGLLNRLISFLLQNPPC